MATLAELIRSGLTLAEAKAKLEAPQPEPLELTDEVEDEADGDDAAD